MSSMIDEVKAIHLSNIELLLPVSYKPDDLEDTLNKLCGVLMDAFDVPKDSCLRTGLLNRDLLELPEPYNTYHNYNYYQLASLHPRDMEPIVSTVYYLFCNRDPIYHDGYDFSKEEKEARKEFYDRLRNKYKNVSEYMERVSSVMFTDIKCYNSLIEKVVFV